MVYNLNDYGRMIADHVRMDAYAKALKAAVTSESVVLDIGVAAGIHALLACKFGARKVYAVEPNDAIHLAREAAAANGFADRIDFIQDVSTNVTLPEPASIIVSDLRGALPLYGQHIPVIIDARQRHLAPGGLLIPQRDTLWAALVEARELYREVIAPWAMPYGLNMEPVKELSLNRWDAANTDLIRSGHLLTDPYRWAVLDYRTIREPDAGQNDIPLVARRDGTAHGWLVWFDAELAGDLGFSNSPASTRIAEVYGRAFFPLREPVPVAEGDIVAFDIQAMLVDDEYRWDWATRIHALGAPGDIKAAFEQSTAYKGALSEQYLARQVSSRRPVLGQEGEIEMFVLSAIDGRATIDQIASRLRDAFPDRFAAPHEAIIYVHQLTQHNQ
ncbi:MAG: class I SAM-dependent methyltransferase [Chloroflexota bacterium]|jgi:protein arginine N-methyltransferase 1